jgi:hypothetical protein
MDASTVLTLPLVIDRRLSGQRRHLRPGRLAFCPTGFVAPLAGSELPLLVADYGVERLWIGFRFDHRENIYLRAVLSPRGERLL